VPIDVPIDVPTDHVRGPESERVSVRMCACGPVHLSISAPLTAAAAERRIRPKAMTEAFIRADVLGGLSERESARAEDCELYSDTEHASRHGTLSGVRALVIARVGQWAANRSIDRLIGLHHFSRARARVL
jgi:hypothetical protein